MSLSSSSASKPNRLQGPAKFVAIAGLCLGALGVLAVTMSRGDAAAASSLDGALASGDAAHLRSRSLLSTDESDSCLCPWSVGCSDSAACCGGSVCEQFGSYSQCVEPSYSTMEDGVRACYATDAETGCNSDSDCCNPDATCSSGVCRLKTTECKMNAYDPDMDVEADVDADAEAEAEAEFDVEAEAEVETELELLDTVMADEEGEFEEAVDEADSLSMEAHGVAVDAMAADSVCGRSIPCAVAKTSGSFTVRLSYTAAARRVIVVDLLNTNNVWFGKGQVTVNAGSGNVDVTVKIYNRANAGSNYMLKAWVVDANIFANSGAPWNHEITSIQSKLSLGTSKCATQVPKNIQCTANNGGSKPSSNSLCANSLPCAFTSTWGKLQARVSYTARGRQRIVMQVEDKWGKVHGKSNKKVNPGSNTVTLTTHVKGLWKTDFKLVIWTVNEYDFHKKKPRQYTIRAITAPLAVGSNKCKSQVAAGSRCNNYSIWPGNTIGNTSPKPSPTPAPKPSPTPAPKPSPSPAPTPTGKFYTSSRAKSAAQMWYNNFMSQTAFGNSQIPNNPKYPNALGAGCSGGACSGVTSESQGYAMMSAGWLKDGGRAAGFYNGWRAMADGPGDFICDSCGDSASGAKCGQANPRDNGLEGVCANDRSTYAAGPANYRGCCNCLTMGTSKGYLSAWKYENGQLAGTGSASDGDIDAITGMIYHAERTNNNAVRRYTLEAILAFIFTDIGYGSPFDTRTVGGKNYYVLKPGSCFGGFSNSYFEPYCYNPSYFAPAQMRLFKEYLQKHGSLLNGTPYANRQAEFAAVLDGAIDTGYQLMYQTQCSNGAVPNWLTLSSNSGAKPWEGLNFACSASGTAARTFGADASRAPWRVCLDYLWYPNQSSVRTPDGKTYGAKQFCNRFAKSIMDQMKSTNCVTAGSMSNCKPVSNALSNKLNGCGATMGPSVTSTDDVQFNAFMYGPLMVPMMVPVDGYANVQQAYLDQLVQWGINQFSSGQSYFSLSQLMIAYGVVGGTAAHPLR